MKAVHSDCSYYENFKRHQKKARFDDSLMTDRSAYISFLEVQLERVSAACMTVEGFSDRISQLQDQFTRMEQKIVTVGRAIQLSTSIVDKQESDFDSVRNRIATFERQASKTNMDLQVVSKEVEDIHRTIKHSVASEVADVQWQATRLESKVIGTIEDRLGGYGDVSSALEGRIQKSIDRQSREMDLRMKALEDTMGARLERKFLNHERLVQDSDSEALRAVCALVKDIDADLREKVKLLEMKVIHDQPIVVAELVKASLPKSVATQVDMTEKLQRVDQTTSKIAQDIISKMATFKSELNDRISDHIKHVDDTVREFIKNNEMTQDSVKNMDRDLTYHLQDLRRELKRDKQNNEMTQDSVKNMDRDLTYHLQDLRRELKRDKHDLTFSTHHALVEDAKLRADVDMLYKKLNAVVRPKKKKRPKVQSKKRRKKKSTKKRRRKRI